MARPRGRGACNEVDEVTTDLTGDYELGEDEFDWDNFLPDPDDAEFDAEAATLEDEAELSLDDSHYDWDGALRDDAEPEDPASDGARAGAAYDRIVDTVRRSFEEPEPEVDTATAPAVLLPPETDAHLADAAGLAAEHGAGLADEHEADLEPEPELEAGGLAASFAAFLASGAAADLEIGPTPDVVFEPTEEPTPPLEHDSAPRLETEPDREPAVSTEPDREPAVSTEPDREPAVSFAAEPRFLGDEGGADDEAELEEWLAFEDDPLFAMQEPEPSVPFEPEQPMEPVAPRFADSAPVVGGVDALEATAFESPESDDAWVREPEAPWEEDDGTVDSAPVPVHAAPETDGRQKPKRSRVLKATMALACLFLVVAVAAVALRALHHPATNASAPPDHVTTPTQAAAGSNAAASTPAGTARLQAATDAVDSATTAASVGLTSLPSFPTPTNVETVINPYISSLQLYETFLTGTKVPPSARPTVASAQAKIKQDLRFLETIEGLPPQQLGAFLAQFDTDATQLQTTLSTLEQDLRNPSA
jgi:hypothetical protein